MYKHQTTTQNETLKQHYANMSKLVISYTYQKDLFKQIRNEIKYSDILISYRTLSQKTKT